MTTRQARAQRATIGIFERINRGIEAGQHYVAKIGDSGRWSHGVHNCVVDHSAGTVSASIAGGRIPLFDGCAIDDISITEHTGGVIRIEAPGIPPVSMFASAT